MTRSELPPDRLTASFTREHHFQLDQTVVGPTMVRLEGLVGEGVDLTPAMLDDMRENTVATHLSKHLLERYMRDAQGNTPYHLYNSIQAITRRWLKECLILKGGTKAGMLTYAAIANQAAALIYSAIVQSTAAGGAPIVKAMLDPYNPAVVTDHVQFIAAAGSYTDGGKRERRAAIFIGPEFGTLTRSQITAAAREASEGRFDMLIACAFNFEAQATDLDQLGPLPILKARMNPDLHMSDELKSTGKGNLFVVFGEPDITLLDTADGEMQVRVNGVDVFDPSTGDIRSDGKDGIAAWFIDTDYNEESFFVRHAYFLGANDPYKSLKTALRAEIDEDAWASLYSDTSRPFARPKTGRIAVKVINHFGDEVLKVFGV